MSDQYVGEIRMFALPYAPVNFMLCQGQLLAIRQFSSLFSLLGVKFGGDGVQTFGLPNFQNRCAVAAGDGPGLTPRNVGETGGVSTVTLTAAEMPAHTHGLVATSDKGTTTASRGNLLAMPTNGGGKTSSTIGQVYSSQASSVTTPLSTSAIGFSGGGQAHDNLMPFLGLNFCIAVNGAYPPRP